MQYNGIRKKVAEEYLDVLKDLGLITYDNNEII
jgi:predicted transcriptional regulator